ncbi:hypothetical protein [Pseudomonas sp.]|uniref:hypothetical protein n=1 Tax=Pseudomonas sp. TaxID=306 RepID=UPI002735BF09|nr:hypothetical protein [Pseudomonas sp.]MDP3816199.1 hypothetical protein [Pseudomonas sp.]
MTDQIEKLEAQVNALAQAVLRLAAVAEVNGQFQPEQLRELRWPGAAFEPEAIRTMGWLCDELAAAREARQLREQAG